MKRTILEMSQRGQTISVDITSLMDILFNIALRGNSLILLPPERLTAPSR